MRRCSHIKSCLPATRPGFYRGRDLNNFPLMPFPKGLIDLTTVLLVFCRLATSLGINPTLPLHLSNQNGSLSSNPLRERCTISPEWIGEGYDAENCASALRLLFFTKVRQHPIDIYEFRSRGDPVTMHAVVRPPLRYVQGRCTVAIVMLDFFARAGIRLPDQPQGLVVPESDLTTWQGLWGSMTRIQSRCGEESAMGWQRAGVDGAIGLFMWGTGSGMDRSVP